MFGGDNNAPDDQNNDGQQGDTLKGVDDLAASMTGGPGAAPAAPMGGDGGFMPTPSEPLADHAPVADAPQTDAPSDDAVPTSDSDAAAGTPALPSDSPAPAASDDGDNLLDLKQQALQQLSPLVGHLDQSPEEKFRTTMMLIQASDDQSLLHEAYEAAQAISDDKVKAQALLDVINEINYFTQKSGDK